MPFATKTGVALSDIEAPRNHPPQPTRPPSIPPLPDRDPVSTVQIPIVRPVEYDDDTIIAEQREDQPTEEPVDDEDGAPGLSTERHPPHYMARFRRIRGTDEAAYSWCDKVPDRRWYWPWHKRHKRTVRHIAYDTDSGWVDASYINKLHFRPLEGETHLLYVQRLHWLSPKTALPQAAAILAWIIGIVIFLMTNDIVFLPRLLALIVWCVGWYAYFLTGWLAWAYTFMVATNQRVIFDTWLPFRLPVNPNEVMVHAIISTDTPRSWLGNVLGYSTFQLGTADSSKATERFENGIKYVRNSDAIKQCITER